MFFTQIFQANRSPVYSKQHILNIRLSLKHHKAIQDPVQPLKTNTTLSSIRGYICKLLRLGKSKTHKSNSKQLMHTKNSDKENQPVPKNIRLLLDTQRKPVRTDLKETCLRNRGNNNMQTASDSEIRAKTKANREKLYKLSETRASVRKRRSANRRSRTKKSSHDGRRDSGGHYVPSNNFLRKRKDACTGIRRSVRNKLAQKNVEMNQLFDREYALTKELTNKCRMYKVQNELYTICDKNLEMSVGQIQQSVEACAKEILQTEHELLKVKNEIKQDISIINNLKRLTINTDLNEYGVAIDLENVPKPPADMKPTPVDATTEQMLFVDNIYEFCDNNASMLV